MQDQVQDHPPDESVLPWIAKRLGIRCGTLDSKATGYDAHLLSTSQVYYGIKHELGGLIWELTPSSLRHHLTFADRLRYLWLQHNYAHLARATALMRHWPSNAPPPLLIKGADLELQVYTSFNLSPGCRMSSDWDLIIPEPAYHDVVAEWTRHFGTPILPRTVHLPHEGSHEVGFNVDGLLIDLHRDPAPRFFSLLQGVHLWKRAQPFQTPDSFLVRVPTPIDRLLLWLINYAKAGGVMRILSWVDLTLILIVLHHQNSDLLTSRSPSEESLHQIMRDAGLGLASREALTQWVTSPFAQTWSHLSAQVKEWLIITQGSLSSEFYFARRLTPESDRLRIGAAQLRLCAPQLRAKYLHRALTSIWSVDR